MLGKKAFWIGMILVICGLYAAVLVLVLQGELPERLARLVAVVLAVHVIEIPLAFRRLRGRQAQPLRVAFATLLFGAAWWLPAQRGLFAVR